MKPHAPTLLGSALRDFRRTWTQLVVTDLLARVLGVAVIAPLVGLLLQIFLASQPEGLVTDAGIASFVLHPTGIVALLVVGAVSLAVLFAETSQLMVIGLGAQEDRRVTWLDALLYGARRFWVCMRLAYFALLRLLLLAAPFLAVVGLAYLGLTARHDVNYYLATRPPEWMALLIGGGLLLAVLAVLVLDRIARWSLALPMVLFEETGARTALAASASVTRPHRVRLTAWLVLWVAAVIVLGALVTLGVAKVGTLLVPYRSGNLTWILVGLTVVLALSFLANLAVSLLANTLFPLIVGRLYRTLAGPGALRPEVAPRGSLGLRASHRLPGKALVALGLGIALLVSVGGYFVLCGVGAERDVVVIGHRGGAAVAPENTDAALARGIADGADWLEIDVQENADGEVVVVHDRDFMRVAGSPRLVHEATSEELADLDVGSYFGPEYASERTPTLRQVLENARGKAGVLIELKYYGFERELEKRVVEVVEAVGAEDEIMVMSMKLAGLRKMAAMRPDWTYGFLNAVSIGDVTRLDVDFLALTAGAATRRMVRRAHAHGLELYAWTVDDPVQMSVLLSRGVDGIITDRVARAHRVREWRAGLTPLGRIVVWLAGETGLVGDFRESSIATDA